MAGNVFSIRLSDEERKYLGDAASEAGLPISTFMKRVILGQMDRDKLSEALLQEQAERESERQLWQNEIRSIMFVKAAIGIVAEKTGCDLGNLDDKCAQAAAALFSEKFPS